MLFSSLLAIAMGAVSLERAEAAPSDVSSNCSVDAALASELARRHADDQKRIEAWRAAQAHGQASVEATQLWQQQARIDADNLDWLIARVRQSGWPAACATGKEGAKAVFLIAQHADHDIALQQELYDALSKAVANGSASPTHLAYLDDRLHVARGEPQRYGTQWTNAGELYPVAEPAGLNARRAAIGLGPAEDYKPY